MTCSAQRSSPTGRSGSSTAPVSCGCSTCAALRRGTGIESAERGRNRARRGRRGDRRLFRSGRARWRQRVGGRSPDVAAGGTRAGVLRDHGRHRSHTGDGPEPPRRTRRCRDPARVPGFAVTVTGAPRWRTSTPACRPRAGEGRPRRGPAPRPRRRHQCVGRARTAGRTIAVHCVTRAELVLALAAWDVVGTRPGDRIEHGAVVPLELIPRLTGPRARRRHPTRSRGGARRWVRRQHDEADDVAHLWRCGSLLVAGVGVAGGSDAPYGDGETRGMPSVRGARPADAVRRPARRRRADPGSPRPRPLPCPRSTTRRARRVASPSARPPTCACSPSRSTSHSPTRLRSSSTRRSTAARRSDPSAGRFVGDDTGRVQLGDRLVVVADRRAGRRGCARRAAAWRRSSPGAGEVER